MSVPGNEGRIAQAWVSVRGGMWGFCCVLWHAEGWTPRNVPLTEAVVKQARTTMHLLADGMRCQHGPSIFQEEFVGSQKSA